MTEPERESMEVDILYVGAGPATLASAYHLMKKVEAHNEACEKTGEAAEAFAHAMRSRAAVVGPALSGALDLDDPKLMIDIGGSTGHMSHALMDRYDKLRSVIVDTPACLGLPDAKAVSELCDGIIMVVRADITSKDDVQATLEILDRRRVIGLLLNGTEVNRRQYGYY